MSKTRLSDIFYKYFSAAFGSTVVIFIILSAVILFYIAYPSILLNGIDFFTRTVWNARIDGKVIVVNGIQTIEGSSYGILVFVVDTLLSSLIAVLLAIPVGVGTAIFLAEVAPSKVAAPISLLVEMLAGIPSIIYGFWGFIVLGPFLVSNIEPALAHYLSFIPFFAGPVDKNYGLLAGGIILAIMIVPIIASLSRDMMTRTPKDLREGARALGLTRWEVTRKIVLPFAKTAIVGSIILGLGRALGEAMAIAMLLGAGNHQLPTNIYSPASTIASFMVLELGNAIADPSKMDLAALMELGIMLLSLTVIVNVVARLIMKQGFSTSSENVVRV